MDWYQDIGVGGHCNSGEGGVSIFITGDDGSSFLILLTPGGLHSWFLQMSPASPNSAFLINSLFNQTNLSALSVSLLNALNLAKFLFALLWFARSSWSKSWRLNSGVSCWTKWTNELSLIVLGNVKKYFRKSMSPWVNCGPMGCRWAFLFFERVFIEGSEYRIWTIKDIAIGRVRLYQMSSFWYYIRALLTVVVQGHFCVGDFLMLVW